VLSLPTQRASPLSSETTRFFQTAARQLKPTHAILHSDWLTEHFTFGMSYIIQVHLRMTIITLMTRKRTRTQASTLDKLDEVMLKPHEERAQQHFLPS
jgi:hypothetical protein